MAVREIVIACKGSRNLPLESLKVIQGNLKDLSEVAHSQLRNEILTEGFISPISVWFDGKEFLILDGTQRYRVLNSLKGEGYLIPEIPVCEIQAKDLKTAKLRIMALISAYGKVTPEGLYEFANLGDLNAEELMNRFKLDALDMNDWYLQFYDDSPAPQPAEIAEVQVEEDLDEHVVRFVLVYNIETARFLEAKMEKLRNKYKVKNNAELVRILVDQEEA